MSVNRFTEFTPQKYVSTHIPLPVEFMAKTLEAKQGQYDNALAQADAAEEAFKINAIDKHQQFKQQKQKEYNDKLTEISDYIVKTGDTSRAREIKSLANRWKNDADVNEMQMSKTQWDLDQAAILKATNDRVYNERNNPFIGFTGANSDGTIQGYRAKGVRPTKDYTAGADLAIDNIKANLDSTGEYVDQTKVLNTAKQVAPTFLMSENNQDFIDEAFGRQMPPYSQLSPELQAQLNDRAANYLALRAAPQIFQKDIVMKASGNGSGGGNGNDLDGMDNIISTDISSLEKSRTGSIKKSDLNQVAVYVDGQVVEIEDPDTKVKRKVISKDLTGQNVFVGAYSSPEKVTEAKAFADNYEALNNIKTKIEESKTNQTYKNYSYNNVEYANAFMDKYKIPKDILVYTSPETGQAITINEIDENGVSTYDKLPNELKTLKETPRNGQRLELDLLANKDLKYSRTFNGNAYYMKDGKEVLYSKIKDSDVEKAAKSKTNENISKAEEAFKLEQKLRGVNLNDPNTKKKFDSYSESLDSKLNAGISELGNVLMTPDTSGDNLFKDNNGQLYSRNWIELSEQQLNDMNIDPAKYKDDIKPGVNNSKWNDDEAMWKVRINIPVSGDISNRVRDMEATKGAFSDTGEAKIPYKQAEVENKIKLIKYNQVLNGQKTFVSEFNSNKPNIIKSLEYMVDKYKGTSALPLSTAKEILKNESNNPQTLYNLYLFLTDPSKQKLLSEATELSGKLNPQVEQDNPLGMK